MHDDDDDYEGDYDDDVVGDDDDNDVDDDRASLPEREDAPFRDVILLAMKFLQLMRQTAFAGCINHGFNRSIGLEEQRGRG